MFEFWSRRLHNRKPAKHEITYTGAIMHGSLKAVPKDR